MMCLFPFHENLHKKGFFLCIVKISIRNEITMQACQPSYIEIQLGSHNVHHCEHLHSEFM